MAEEEEEVEVEEEEEVVVVEQSNKGSTLHDQKTPERPPLCSPPTPTPPGPPLPTAAQDRTSAPSPAGLRTTPLPPRTQRNRLGNLLVKLVNHSMSSIVTVL